MATDKADGQAKDLRERAQKLLALDYFSMLGVARAATPAEVKTAFIEAAKTWHPDRIPSDQGDVRPLASKVFSRLELASATLADPARRARYIEDLAKPAKPASSQDMAGAEAALEFRKAEVSLKKKDLLLAEHHLRRATQLAPANVGYQVHLVWIQVTPDATAARLQEVIKQLDRLVAADPQCERAYFFRAQLRKRVGLTREAVSDFERAASLDPKNLDAAREVRIHKMRQERAAPKGSASSGASPDAGGGVGGFFKRLLKR